MRQFAAPRDADALVDQRLDGRVVARFVVDSLGRADLETLQAVASTHPLFADAVRAALPASAS